MIEIIKEVGKVVRNSDIGKDLDLVRTLQKEIVPKKDAPDRYELILDLNVRSEPDADGSFASVTSRAFTYDVYREGLLYPLLSGKLLGGVLSKEKYEKDKSEKNDKSMLRCMEFLDISKERLDEIKEVLEAKIQNIPEVPYVVLFCKDGQKPIDTHKDAFLEICRNSDLKLSKNEGRCHLCGNHVEERYDSCGFTCYTNDKKIFNKTYSLSYAVCDDCMIDILYGRWFANKYLTAYWNGNKVLFLPNMINEKVLWIFIKNELKESDQSTNLLSRISKNEAAVLRRIGESEAGMDLIFYDTTPGKSDWKIKYSIKNVNPSRFRELARLKIKYQTKEGLELQLRQIEYYLLGKVKEVTDKKDKNVKIHDMRGVFSTGEAKKFLNDILNGEKINRNIFFSRAMAIYKHDYLNDKVSMTRLHRIYNFLVDCGCLKTNYYVPIFNSGEDDMMKEYNSIDEFFEDNKEFFDTDVKRAWFILGRLYNAIIWESKKYYSGETATTADAHKKSDELKKAGSHIEKEKKDELRNTKSYLEKSFFFGKKFDYSTFVAISNKCSEVAIKYGVQGRKHISEMSTEAKIRMGSGDKKLSPDEAKYIFFWGLSQWFVFVKADEKENAEEEEENKETEVIEGDEE